MHGCVVVTLQKNDNEEKKSAHVFLSRLHREKNHFLSNIMVLVPLKQEQVEVSTTDFPADYADSILLHGSVVEELNETIRVSYLPPPL